MRQLDGLLLVCSLLTVLVGCGSGEHSPPKTAPTQSEVALDLPDFSVSDMLAEFPGPVRTTQGFAFYAGDLIEASDLAGLEPPAEAEAAGDWVSYLNGREKDGEPLPVFVPFTIPLAGSAPAALVEEDLGWSIADVERFASWTSYPDSRCKSATCSRFTTTVAVGHFDDETLAALPESGGIRSAGVGPDLSAELENSTPARPAGTPLRMAVDSGRLMASPYSDVVRDWLQGPSQSLADDPTLISMARILDRADVYAAMMTTPRSGGRLGIPERVFEALGYSPKDFPAFDAYAFGWSVVEGDPEVTVVYHAPRGVAARAVRGDVADRWAGRTLRGREMSSLLKTREIQVVDGNVVVKATPAPGLGPNIPFLMTEAGDVPFLTR